MPAAVCMHQQRSITGINLLILFQARAKLLRSIQEPAAKEVYSPWRLYVFGYLSLVSLVVLSQGVCVFVCVWLCDSLGDCIRTHDCWPGEHTHPSSLSCSCTGGPIASCFGGTRTPVTIDPVTG